MSGALDDLQPVLQLFGDLEGDLVDIATHDVLRLEAAAHQPVPHVLTIGPPPDQHTGDQRKRVDQAQADQPAGQSDH